MELYFIMWELHSLKYENYSIYSKHLSRNIHKIYSLQIEYCAVYIDVDVYDIMCVYR